jgi:hypothetical protein
MGYNSRMKIINVPILLMLLVCPLLLSSMTRIYEERTGDQVTTHRFVIETTPPGYSIHLQSETGDEVIKQTFALDTNLAALSWTFDNPKEKTNVTATRKENKIFLQGTDRGKPITKTFKINDLPWNQSFNIGLERFALSSEKTMLFWAIGTKGPGNMKITKFKVKKRGIETIDLSGSQVEAVYLTISLTGILSMFWTGNYWYRQADGGFLRYKGKNGPGQPLSIMELVSASLKRP